MSLLKAEGLVKVYGRRRVVDGVSFEVQQGEIVGLLGPNGAGKTTSFRMTCGLVIPNGGRVLLDDKEITKWPMFKRSRDGGMGYLAQEQSVFRKLTVQQNLLAIMELIGMAPKERRRRSEELVSHAGLRLRAALSRRLGEPRARSLLLLLLPIRVDFVRVVVHRLGSLVLPHLMHQLPSLRQFPPDRVRHRFGLFPSSRRLRLRSTPPFRACFNAFRESGSRG